MAAYDSSKDKVLFEGTATTVVKNRYRIAVYQYEKGQPKLAIENETLRADGSVSWRLIAGRIPSEVVGLLITELPQALPYLGLAKQKAEEAEEKNNEAEEEVEVPAPVAASALQQEVAGPKKRMSIKGVTAK